jgi:hypothetical protein
MVSFVYQNRGTGALTGGCCSVFSAASGLAARFANTPSDPDPPPYIPVVVGAKIGNWVDSLSMGGACALGAITCSLGGEACPPRINLCLSSPSFSSSLSAPSASNVSARVRSTGWLCREVDEVRERKEGGGEVGVSGVAGPFSSFSDTCGRCQYRSRQEGRWFRVVAWQGTIGIADVPVRISASSS